MKFSLLILLTLVFSFSAFAQKAGIPKTIPPKSSPINDPTLTELTDLLGESDYRCGKKISSVSGAVGKIFANDGGTISVFQILDAKRKPHFFNLNSDPTGSLGKYSLKTIKSVIQKKRKVKVWSVECGEPPEGPLDYVTQITVQ